VFKVEKWETYKEYYNLRLAHLWLLIDMAAREKSRKAKTDYDKKVLDL